jgi:3-oxoacyl-[acyl-carrier-protein] synthase-3
LVMIAPNTNKWVTEIVSENDPEDSSYYPYMNGKVVFKNAISRFEEVINTGLNHNNLKTEDIGLLIPHQANLRISQFIQRKLKLRNDQVYNNIMRYGNTTAASIPIALTEAWEEGKVKEGDIVVLAAFGAGFSWGSTIIKW